jgi:hypothetical protein
VKRFPRTRQAILAIALLATLVAVFSIEDEPPPERTARQARPRPAAQQVAIAPATGERQASDTATTESPAADETKTTAIDPFRAKSWAPPPPPPPKPTAPALPFQYLGKVIDGGAHRYFLSRQNNYLTVAAGDSIDANYLLERAEPGRLVFLYRPMQQRQNLPITAD